MERCNRIGLDGAVNVRQLERYVGDHLTVAPSTDRHPVRVADEQRSAR